MSGERFTGYLPCTGENGKFRFDSRHSVRDGPLENVLGGGGLAKYKKNIRAREN